MTPTTVLKDHMSNAELQDAIVMTNAMAKNTPADAATHQAVMQHLQKLLEIQRARAAWVSCDPVS